MQGNFHLENLASRYGIVRSYNLEIKIEIIDVKEFSKISEYKKEVKNFNDLINQPDVENLVEEHFNKKGFQVSNVRTNQNISSHDNLVKEFFRDELDFDHKTPMSGFPDLILKDNAGKFFVVEVKRDNQGPSRTQLEVLSEIDYPAYFCYVSFEEKDEEYLGLRCIECQTVVGFDKRKEHARECEYDYCAKCYKFWKDLDSHNCRSI